MGDFTVSIDEVVSIIAAAAGSGEVPGAAEVGNGDALSSVEEVSVGALEADLLVPVPGVAAEV